VKLFQIEEPDGGPADPDAWGAAIGIDTSSVQIEVAFSVGGNALILADREGYELALQVPSRGAAKTQWQSVFEAARVRAERALARPVTHAVIVVAAGSDGDFLDRLSGAAAAAGLEVLRLVAGADLAAGSVPALAAATLAEDLGPRPV
jgi:hypothetical protein